MPIHEYTGRGLASYNPAHQIRTSKGKKMSFNFLGTMAFLVTRYFMLLPIGSLCIFLIFAALGMRNYRVAWFLSLSVPGAVGCVILIAGLATDPEAIGYLIFFPFIAFVCPAFWVFPTVVVIQVRTLLKKNRDVMTRQSYVWAAVLLCLYFWTGLLTG
jgi:hypothetical protein